MPSEQVPDPGECGPHCGTITDPLSGYPIKRHCDCDELCHAGMVALCGPARGDDPRPAGQPMCWSWYERAGEHRPWHSRADACRCGVSAQKLPEQHGSHCPLRQHWDRDHDSRSYWPAH